MPLKNLDQFKRVEPKGLSIEEGAAVLKCQTKEPWSAAKPGQPEIARAGSRIVAMMFLSLYQVLNLSRRLTKQAG